jgi:hypothetical protein
MIAQPNTLSAKVVRAILEDRAPKDIAADLSISPKRISTIASAARMRRIYVTDDEYRELIAKRKAVWEADTK